MVKAQEWLDKNYPKSQKSKEIFARNEDLEGKLVIEGYKEVRNIDCGNNGKLQSVELKSLPKLTHFYANGCQIKDIKIENCPNIEDFNVSNNLLESTKFLDDLNPEKLETLSIHSNNFQEQGLGFLSKFVNLRGLYIDNCYKERFEKNIYNRWYGSLQPLQNLNKLRWLSIGNTNIDSGLEYLPESVKKIRCSNDFKEVMGCSRIKKELEEIARLPGVTEKLEGKEEGEEWFAKNWYRTAPWWEASSLFLAKEIEKNKGEKDKLWREIYNNSEKRRNLSLDSQEYEDLFREKEKMEKGLEEKSKTIRKLSESREKIKKRDYIRFQSLQNWIRKSKQDLERKKMS